MKTESPREIEVLKEAVYRSLVKRPEDYGSSSLDQLKQDLINNNHILKALIKRALYDKHGLIVEPRRYSLTFIQVDNDDFRFETDLGRRLSLGPLEVHKIGESATLALSSIHRRFEDMNTYDSITGSIDNDLPLFQEILFRLARELSPKASEASFQRLIELRNLPSYKTEGQGTRIDVSKLLAVRESSACREFRRFLSTVIDMSDKDINEYFDNIKSKLSYFLQSPSAKICRFFATTAVGFIAGLPGVLAGTTSGAIDTFIVDKVFRRSCVLLFINNLYPAIFR
jgi:hypothetical protein